MGNFGPFGEEEYRVGSDLKWMKSPQL